MTCPYSHPHLIEDYNRVQELEEILSLVDAGDPSAAHITDREYEAMENELSCLSHELDIYGYDMDHIHVWPDGDWCWDEELEEYLSPGWSKSDDYETLCPGSSAYAKFIRENELGIHSEIAYLKKGDR